MFVALVILTFALCILVDWWLKRGEEQEAVVQAPVPQRHLRPVLSPPFYVDGFRLHEELALHPGHAWAVAESADLLRVGLDDFAAKLVGKVESLDLPKVGEMLAQGRESWAICRAGRRAPMLSPVSGRVIEVNSLLRSNPELPGTDPYGDGWLFMVQTTDLRTNLNNLLSGSMVRRWMEDVCARLRTRLDGGLAFSFADGGTAVKDISALVDAARWKTLVEEFLLTSPSP
jgi:glycine cleavage system H lipoate-binding protein